jgi:hypothetical protein
MRDTSFSKINESGMHGEYSIFRDNTTRDDYRSYMADKKRLPKMGPAAYHTGGRPFLKKTYNASLPPAKFV